MITSYDFDVSNGVLLIQYGSVKDVRMTLDDKGQPKGFAFVEFEQEVRTTLESTPHRHTDKDYPQKDALAALAANNYELKKRRIAVTMADTRVKNSKNS